MRNRRRWEDESNNPEKQYVSTPEHSSQRPGGDRAVEQGPKAEKSYDQGRQRVPSGGARPTDNSYSSRTGGD